MGIHHNVAPSRALIPRVDARAIAYDSATAAWCRHSGLLALLSSRATSSVRRQMTAIFAVPLCLRLRAGVSPNERSSGNVDPRHRLGHEALEDGRPLLRRRRPKTYCSATTSIRNFLRCMGAVTHSGRSCPFATHVAQRVQLSCQASLPPARGRPTAPIGARTISCRLEPRSRLAGSFPYSASASVRSPVRERLQTL